MHSTERERFPGDRYPLLTPWESRPEDNAEAPLSRAASSSLTLGDVGVFSPGRLATRRDPRARRKCESRHNNHGPWPRPLSEIRSRGSNVAAARHATRTTQSMGRRRRVDCIRERKPDHATNLAPTNARTTEREQTKYGQSRADCVAGTRCSDACVVPRGPREPITA